MTASTEHTAHATDAISTAFNAELFESRCAERGATTNEQKAALVGVDWSTIHRFRKGEMGPRLEVARQMAERLGTTVDELFPPRKAA